MGRQVKKYDRGVFGIPRTLPVPVAIPETCCDHCKREDIEDDNFDENGYSVPKAVLQAAKLARARGGPTFASVSEGHFRFLDLPPELRNRIYEFAMQRQNQPVCIRDRLLRPSEELPDTNSVRRQCTAELVCLPCQLHELLGTGHIGLSRANKQLHLETMLIPCTVNTFNVHNLYYLHAFLSLIGQKGRQSLKSLSFSWRLPEEDAKALGAYTAEDETYTLLGECRSLTKLHVDLDIMNMLTWRGDGTERSTMLSYLYLIPHIALVYELRGLKDVKIGWESCPGLEGMDRWAKVLAGYWRLPHSTESWSAVAVDTEVQRSRDSERRFLHWKTHAEVVVDDDSQVLS